MSEKFIPHDEEEEKDYFEEKYGDGSVEKTNREKSKAPTTHGIAKIDGRSNFIINKAKIKRDQEKFK